MPTKPRVRKTANIVPKAAPASNIPEVKAAPKAALAASNPKWPPIEVRYKVLLTVYVVFLLSWADRLGVKAANKTEAIAAILRSEYGDAAYDKWAKA